MQVRKVACASCGATISVPDDVTRFTCSYCGSALVLEQGEGYVTAKLAEQVTAAVRQVGAELGNKLDDIEAALDIDASGQALRCASCGRADAVRKLTAIVHEAPTSALARTLRFPFERPDAHQPSPSRPSANGGGNRCMSVGCAAFGLVMLAAGVLCIVLPAATFGGNGSNIVFLGFFGGVGVLSLIAPWLAHRGDSPTGVERSQRQLDEDWEHSQRRWNEYQLALQRYDKAYYCSRCDVVFVAGDRRKAPPSDLISLLK
jgi:DNA-directed RNA polymerase subunit RPC12/RpoP